MKKIVQTGLVGITLILIMVTNTPLAQASNWLLGSEMEGGPKDLVVGDRVEITVKAFTPVTKKTVNDDRSYTLKIANPKPGQECQTTDKTLKDDGQVKGYCEAKGDPGNMEIYVEADSRDSLKIDDVVYETQLGARYNAMFNDPKVSCQEGAKAPTNVTLIKQNDVTVKVEWQQSETYVGTFDILYGTDPVSLTNKRRTNQKVSIIDSLDPSKAYYFKVQANSSCKWTASSGLLKYIPTSGAISAANEKKTATPSASVQPKASPGTAKVSSPSAVPTPTLEPTPSPALIEPSIQPVAVASPASLPVRVWNSITNYVKKLWPF